MLVKTQLMKRDLEREKIGQETVMEAIATDSRGIEAELKAIQGDNAPPPRKAKKVRMPSRVSGHMRWDVLRRVQCLLLCCRRLISPLFFVCPPHAVYVLIAIVQLFIHP